MPKNRVEDRLRPITPQLAWRVAVLGGIAFVLFGIVFFRLWYLQVLTGDTARVAASQNGRRTERIEAPRGDIVDREARALVRTKKAAVVQLVPSKLPEQVRKDADDYRKRWPRPRTSGSRTSATTTRSSASSRTTGARRPRPRNASVRG